MLFRSIIVQTAARDTAVTKVELIIDGVAREAVVNKLNPLEYNIVVRRDVSKADIRVTPNSYEVHEILIGGAYDSIDNITGARTRNNYPMELGNEFTVPISVTASDKLTKEDGYKLIIKKVDLNMDLASVKVDETSLTKGAKDTYTYIANTNVLNSKANITLISVKPESTVKLERMIPDKGKSPVEYSYEEIGKAVKGGGVWDDVSLDTKSDINRFRVTVTAEDGYTSKTYYLVIRTKSENTEIDYIKVGQYYAKPTNDNSKWEVKIPNTTKFATFTIKTYDELASILKLNGSGYEQGIYSDVITDMDLQTANKVLTFEIKSQSGNTKRTITLTIIGDETAPAIKKITVNGDKAKDPTVSETNYIYDTVLPNASELLVGAEGTLINYYVEIDGGDRKLSKNEKKVANADRKSVV